MPTHEIKAYVINLDRSPERWELIKDSFLHTNIKLIRVPAIDGADLKVSQADLDKLRPYHGRSFQVGELGCYYSHLKALQTFLEGGDKFSLIMEDDARAAPSIKQLPQLVDLLSSEDYGTNCMVNLANPPRKYFKKLGKSEISTPIVRTFRFPISGMGILWSRPAASEFLRLHSQPLLPVDCAFRELNRTHRNGYGVLTRLIEGSAGLSSEIGEFGDRNIRLINQGWRLKAWRIKHDFSALRQYLAGE